jgi:hypothetical protein
MGCTNSKHPESRIYEILDKLSDTIPNFCYSDDTVCSKCEKSLSNIDSILLRLSVISPFIRVEIRLVQDLLQKNRPKVYRILREQFIIVLEHADSSSASSSKHPPSTASPSTHIPSLNCSPDPRFSNRTASNRTTAFTPTLKGKDTSKRKGDKQIFGNSGHERQGCRLSIDSAGSTQPPTTRENSSDHDIENGISRPRLRSIYQNSQNHSQETLDEYGFFNDDEEM